MRVPIPEIDPVAIALDEIDASGDVRFSGVDLESGARVTVLIERKPADTSKRDTSHDATGLVLVLTMEALQSRQ